jgi:hypothetical protein
MPGRIWPPGLAAIPSACPADPERPALAIECAVD